MLGIRGVPKTALSLRRSLCAALPEILQIWPNQELLLQFRPGDVTGHSIDQNIGHTFTKRADKSQKVLKSVQQIGILFSLFV